MTPATLRRVPNQPRTPMRSFRCGDELWDSARERAAERSESVTDVLRRALEEYVAEPVTGTGRRPRPTE